MRFLTFIFLILIHFSSWSQKSKTIDSLMNIRMITISYAFNLPSADLAERVGFSHELSLGYHYKTKKGWLMGIDVSSNFGNQLRSDSTVLDPLKTSNGQIIGADGRYADVRMFFRGYKAPVFKFGKIFQTIRIGGSVNSGFFATAGVGFMQYKVKINDVSKTVFQINDDYIKGYDHLTNGLLLTQNIGYFFVDKHKMVNFSIELELNEAFTQNRRDWNFNTKSPMNEPRFDMLYGIKIKWFYPLYPKMATGYYFY